MGIRTIIDMRSEEERHNYPQLHDDAFRISHISILPETWNPSCKNTEGKIKTDTVYRLVEEMNRKAGQRLPKENLRSFFDNLLDRNESIPPSSTAPQAKDVRGIASALVLAALGSMKKLSWKITD